ncbi:MAG: 3-dehydroquinate synthase [Zetaproteobacteria bacterium]|nr:MAG: 3-dehydroquinate synthase [Zetaproteobacteria bacterium]
MRREITVRLGARSYPIVIAPGILAEIGEAMRARFPDAKRTLVVTNEVVAPLYLDAVLDSLARAGWQAESVVLPDGEQEKTVARWQEVIDALMAMRLSRNEPLVALGGGVIGDLAGFAAACYRRGIPFVQAPTTLLAQVDSSVGGKTAVNHPLGKNMIGAFHQPALVWIDPETLHTLARRHFRAGMAEVVKYGAILDAAFFGWLEAERERLLALEMDALVEAIARSCAIKAEVVAADEREETGTRALLNLGHTFGHAIERLTGYGPWLHGEAVAAGMHMAAALSERIGAAEKGVAARIAALLEALQLPTRPPAFSLAQWLEAMGHDKKAQSGRLRFVLLRGIGQAFVSEVPMEALEETLYAFGAED